MRGPCLLFLLHASSFLRSTPPPLQALSHNMAVTMVALRRYHEAAFYCQQAMKAANSNSQHLTVTHPWVKAIKECLSFCSKMSFSVHYQRYRMKPADCHQPDFQQMQRIIHETRTMPIFSTMLQQHRQKLQQRKENELEQQNEEARYRNEIQLRNTANATTQHAATAVYAGAAGGDKRPATAATGGSGRAGSSGGRRGKSHPLASLRLYVKNATYQEFVQEYMQAKKQERLQKKQQEQQFAITAAPSSPSSSVCSAKRRQLQTAIAQDGALRGKTGGSAAAEELLLSPQSVVSPGSEASYDDDT